MFCRFCGKMISSEDKFCSHCGKQLNSNKKDEKINIKAHDDEMSFSSDDLKKLQAFLKNSEESSAINSRTDIFTVKTPVFSTDEVCNDYADPELTVFMDGEAIREDLDIKDDLKLSYKSLFLKLLIIGIGIGVILGMIVNFGLDIL